jgi:hypothetical protein
VPANSSAGKAQLLVCSGSHGASAVLDNAAAQYIKHNNAHSLSVQWYGLFLGGPDPDLARTAAP